MPWTQAPGAAGPAADTLPASAIHDTIAAIAAQAEYHRSLTSTLWSRVGEWLLRWLNAVIGAFEGSGAGRAITIALLAVLGVLVIARLIVAARATALDRERRAASRVGGRASDPWADAQRLAASGAFTDAAHALLAALLRALADRGEVRLHSSKTAGDYARELARRGSPRGSPFDAFRRRYERTIYGAGTCSPAEYAALLSAATPMLPGASDAFSRAGDAAGAS